MRLNPKISLQEYFVDLLGGLFPGILFIISFFVALAPPLIDCYYSKFALLEGKSFVDCIPVLLESAKHTPSSLWFVTFLIMTLLAYVIGHVFYRHDPKKPDRESFKRLRREEFISFVKDKSEINLKLSFIPFLLERQMNKILANDENLDSKFTVALNKNLACSSINKCQFPYPEYSSYLRSRGLSHLISLVKWNKKTRSKTYMNILKIRLKYHFTERCGTLVRNEGHIRLASSAWYVAKVTRIFGYTGFTIIILNLLISFFLDNNVSLTLASFYSQLTTHVVAIISPIIIFPGGGYQKLVMGKAYKVARWLNKNGIIAIVLKYRLKPEEALRDAQRAVSLVRKEAKNYGIYKNKIGVIGFSAGANLAGNLVENNQHFNIYDAVDSISFIPDFWAGIYGPYGDIDESMGRDSSGRRTFKKYEAHNNIPPTFLVHASNDSRVPVNHSISLYNLLLENGIPAELHVYEQGEHGFALEEDRGAAVTSTVNAWSRRLLEWLKIRGVL